MAKQRIILFMVTCLCYQLACSQDVSSINGTDASCGAEGSAPSNVTISDILIESARVQWEVKFSMPPDFAGFEVLYWPVTMTMYQSVSSDRFDVRGITVLDLLPYTQYRVAVRWFCQNQQRGLASPSTTFTTEATDPSAPVTNVTAASIGSSSLVNITWLPLLESQWNGQPYGYYVHIGRYSLESMCGGEPIRLETRKRQYPGSNLTYEILYDGCYQVNVFPTNNRKVGPSSQPLYFTYTNVPLSLNIFPADEVPTPAPKEPTPFFESPYVYIIVVAVVAVIPVVMGIVLFKKAIEKKRKKVQYCREIDDVMYSGIPLQTLSPLSPQSSILPSPQASTTMPGSSRPQPFSPIGSSPMPPVHPHMYPQVDPPDYAEAQNLPPVFGMAPARSPPATKPHPPYFPRSAEGGIPMTRSYTLEQPHSELFGGTQQEARQGRQRAHTEGGIPSPYENPVNGSSTLSRIDCSKRSHAMDEKGAIPPPPSHAPPPLTQSSLEIFARMRRSPPHGNQRNQQMEQQHGMSQRSYSTTNTDGLTSPNSNPMRTIRSAGQLHSLDAMPEEGIGRRPPQESGADHTSALTQERSAASFEKQAPLPPPPPSHTARYHSPPAHPNLPPQPQYVPNGSAITTNSDFSSFSEVTDTDSVQYPAGRARHVPAHQHGPREKMAGPRGYERESVFSETSTEEPSISSGSIRGGSPSAAPSWVNGSLDIGHRRSLSPGTPSTDTRTLRSEVHSPPKSPP